MNSKNGKLATKAFRQVRCAIYTRKSTEDGLEQEFNSLDAQRESGEAFIKSQMHEGWDCIADHYDDGGFTGGNMDRPALQQLMADIKAGMVDCVVVYKVDRLSRSLLDFAKMMEVFEKHRVSFVSVTQQFNTSTSMGRLVLNVLLSFAQFEREMISERTRDKIAATRRKGKWAGGMPLLGFDVDPRGSKLLVNRDEADRVLKAFELYLEHERLLPVVQELDRRGWRNKEWTTRKGTRRGGRPFDKNSLWHLLTNVTYIGKVKYKDEIHDGEHQAIVPDDVWQRVQAKLRHNGRSGGGMVRNNFGALLKGLLHCVPCDCAMSPTHSTRQNKRYRYYVCTGSQKRGRHTCPTGSVPAGEIEQFIVAQIKSIGRGPELVAETVRRARGKAAECVQELVHEEHRLERELADRHRALQDTVSSPVAAGDLATARLADLQEGIVSAERRLTEVRNGAQQLRREIVNEADVKRAIGEFDPVWESLSSHEQARLLRVLIKQIDYDGRDGMISITFHPAGIKTLANQDQGDAT
jgi:site-specific DNA recombinase